MRKLKMSKDVVVHIYAEPDIIQISEIRKVNRFFRHSSFEFSITAKENAKLGQTAKLFIKFSNNKTKIRNLNINIGGRVRIFCPVVVDDNTQYIPISIIDS